MADIDTRVRWLRASPDLQALTEDTLTALAIRCTEQSLPPATQLLEDDADADAFYVIATGQLIVTWRSANRRAPIKATLGPGGTVGENCVGGTGSMGAWAVGPVHVLRLPPQTLREVAAAHPELDLVLRQMAAIQGRRADILRGIHNSPLFSQVAISELSGLLAGSTLIAGAPGELVIDGREPLDGVVLVLDGDCRVRPTGKLRVGRRSAEPRSVSLAPGGLIGDDALIHGGPLLQDVTAGQRGCALLHIHMEAFRQCFMASASFRRAVLASPILDEGDRHALFVSVATAGIDPAPRVFYALVADDGGDVATLADWLAQAAAAQWGDRVVVVRPDPAVHGDPIITQQAVGDGFVATVRPPSTMTAPTQDLVELILWGDLALLDLSMLPTGDHAVRQPWMDRVQRVVMVATRAYALPTEWLPARSELGMPIYTAVVPGDKLGAGEERIVPYGTLRLHRDLLARARQHTPLAALSAGERAQVDRWMRGVTGRRFGVALGGGGALSYAELAMLQRLHEVGIPVDLVAGVSGGAIVGAFYCGGMDLQLPADLAVPDELRDLPGLALLCAIGHEIEAASTAALVSAWSMAALLERHLGHQRLEDLLIPFYPTAVDGDRAVQRTIRVGPLAFGARASGAFPGTFTPATTDRVELSRPRVLPPLRRGDLPTPTPGPRRNMRWLDGGLLNNIPDDALYLEDAAFVLACNVVPAPAPRDETSSKALLKVQDLLRRPANRFARFAREFDPLVRFDDVNRAIFMLMYQPADWTARAAHVKYQAQTAGFAFTDWARGDEIRQQALSGERGEVLDAAVDEAARTWRAMRWQRDPDEHLPAVAAKVSAELKLL